MSVGQLKREVDGLSVEDRLELAEYLRATAKRDDPQWQAEIARRLDRCLAGQGHPKNELLALHDKLGSAGE
jgi:hypothetical protein